MRCVAAFILLLECASAFVAVPLVRPPPQLGAVAASPLVARPSSQSAAAALARTAAPQMGLFGLGTPEIAIIAVVGLLVLGPDQLKKLAKDVGKVSAELKQVPEEFNKGMEIGQEELAKKAGQPAAVEPAAPPTPAPADDTPPPPAA